MASWEVLDEYVLLEIFSYLDHKSLSRILTVCQRWHFVASDDLLWRRLVKRRLKSTNKLTLPPSAKSWKSELKRLTWLIPTTSKPEVINDHSEEVNHVAFSGDGQYFATVGNDSMVFVWRVREGKLSRPEGHRPISRVLFRISGEIKKIHSEDLQRLGWQAARFCEFNPDSTMLMVSGVLMGDITGRIMGEIVVFTMKPKVKICAKMSNKPWDVTGCWYGNKYVISSEFKWLAHMVSQSMLWINKVNNVPFNFTSFFCIYFIFR